MSAVALVGALPESIASAVRAEGAVVDAGAPNAIVWAAGAALSWPDARELLTAAFGAAKRAAALGGRIACVVREEDLAGVRGAPAAIAACGLLSGTRALAVEGIKRGAAANTLAVDDETDPRLLASTLITLLQPSGPTGTLIQLGRFHLARSAP